MQHEGQPVSGARLRSGTMYQRAGPFRWQNAWVLAQPGSFLHVMPKRKITKPCILDSAELARVTGLTQAHIRRLVAKGMPTHGKATPAAGGRPRTRFNLDAVQSWLASNCRLTTTILVALAGTPHPAPPREPTPEELELFRMADELEARFPLDRVACDVPYLAELDVDFSAWEDAPQ